MNENIRLYIHAGQGKTGSSIIQNFLDLNRAVLAARYGTLYPNFSGEGMDKGRQHNHALLFHSDPEEIENTLSEAVAFAVKHQLPKVIISNEGILDWFLLNTDDFPRIMKNLAAKHQLEIFFIIYLRRIDEWIQSAWKQWGIRDFDSIEAYADAYLELEKPFFVQGLEILESIVGASHIIIQPYEQQQFHHGLIPNFLEHIDIPPDDFSQFRGEKGNVAENRGFSRDVTEILQLNKQSLANLPNNNQYLNMFSRLLGDEFQKEPFQAYTLLGTAYKARLLEKYQPYYEEIARKYLGRSDGVLFYDPTESAASYDETYQLTLEKVIPIFTKMIFTLSQENVQQYKMIRNLKIQLDICKAGTPGRYEMLTYTLRARLGAFLRTGHFGYAFGTPVLFDRDWYIAKNLDVRSSGLPAYSHYLEIGWKENRDPNPFFSSGWYCSQHPEVRSDPLAHYLHRGWKLGYNPSPQFSLQGYLRDHPEAQQARTDPLSLFVRNNHSKF